MIVDVFEDEFGLQRHVRNASQSLDHFGGSRIRWYERALLRSSWWRVQQAGMKLILRRVWQ